MKTDLEAFSFYMLSFSITSQETVVVRSIVTVTNAHTSSFLSVVSKEEIRRELEIGSRNANFSEW
jgi:hypothetical protein